MTIIIVVIRGYIMMKKLFLLFIFFVCNASMHCMELALLPSDCLRHMVPFFSIKKLFQLQRISKAWNQATHIDAALIDQTSCAYEQCKNNYCLNTQVLLWYTKKLYPVNENSDKNKLAIVSKLWESYESDRNNEAQRITPNIVYHKSVINQVNFYSGHPGGSTATPKEIYKYFDSCEHIALAQRILKESNNFQLLGSNDLDFTVFFRRMSMKSGLIGDFLWGEHGRGIDCIDKNGRTFLHVACIKNDYSWIQWFLVKNIHVNKIDNFKRTALDYASDDETKRLLIQYGAYDGAELLQILRSSSY
jgi:hypothetical protein